MEVEENSDCQDFVHESIPNITQSVFPNILPYICKYFDRKSTNATPETEKFYRLCCHSNKTIHFGNVSEELCRYLQSTSSEDESIYRDLCVVDSDEGYDNNYYFAIIYVVLFILSPIGLTANTLIMMTVYKVKRLRNTTGYIICNLAFADILLIVDMLLYVILGETNWRVREYIFPSFDVSLGSASLLLVTAVSVERGIAVARPLKYPRYLSEKRAKLLVICIWVYCFVLFIFGVLRIWINNKYYPKVFFYLTVSSSFFFPCILVVFSYNVIVFSALKTMKMEKKICKVIVAISLMNDQKLDQVATVRPNRCRELKVAVKVAALTIPFVCGWGYFMICNVYEIAASFKFKGVANFMILFLPYIVSCVNPLTYLMFTRSLRQGTWMILSRSNACMKIFKLVCHRKEHSSNSSAHARLVRRDRRMQFTPEHSKWLEARHAQTDI